MRDLMRVFNQRGPVILSENNIISFGVHTHPINFQSDRYLNWLGLCKAKNTDGLKSEAYKFLQGTDSIHVVEDIGSDWAPVIRAFFSIGNDITAEKACQIIKQFSVEKLLGSNRSSFTTQFSRLADTALSLSYLRNLGNPDNMDYQSAIKVMAFTEKFVGLKMNMSDRQVTAYFLKPLILPICFFRIDPCEVIVGQGVKFPYLVENSSGCCGDSHESNGCVSEDCTCHENEECVEQSKCCARPTIEIIDLMVVKEKTKCYVAGDLSYIRNVLAGEVLSTKHRRLERTEQLIETESDIRDFEERYLQTEDKTALHKESEDVIKQDLSLSAGLTTNSSFGIGIGKIANLSFGTNSTTNFSTSLSKTLTNKEARDYSKDVIDRATRQMEEKVRKLSSVKKILETQEKNKHVFDNSQGDNVNGQYLYVEKKSEAVLCNYGKTAVLDLILPEPAALYKKLMQLKFEFNLTEPLKPTIVPQDITASNYLNLAMQYGIKDFDFPPVLTKNVSVEISGTNPTHRGGTLHTGAEMAGLVTRSDISVTIPQDYVSDSMTSFASMLDWVHDGTSLAVYLDGSGVVYYPSGSNVESTGVPALEGTQSLPFESWGIRTYDVTVTVHCKLKDELALKWQLSIYNKIMDAYNSQKKEYDDAYNAAKADFDQKEADFIKESRNKDPFVNRETEKAELKRMAISYITCQFFDRFNAMKSRVKPCGYSEMNIKEAEREGRFIRFFEEAFNWNLITYVFYPYFWGKKCGWGNSIKEESGDLIFEQYLRAGSCRVLIPIRNGYFDYVSYYLQTGEIWGGTGMPPLFNDPHYVSLAQEIKEQNENFNTDRPGTIDVTNGSNEVVLNGTDYYWDSGLGIINTANVNADIDRAIILDFDEYKIISIVRNTAVLTNDSWIITLDRNYEGVTSANLNWSTGGVFVGTPWEFVTPTTLTFLREKSNCLPCFPLNECKEQ